MTMTRPLRRMTLHFSHMGFTDGLTFIVFNHSFQRFVSFQLKWRLLTAPGDPAAGQVIRGHLHRHLVAGQNPDCLLYTSVPEALPPPWQLNGLSFARVLRASPSAEIPVSSRAAARLRPLQAD